MSFKRLPVLPDPRRNRRTAILFSALVAAMVGLSFASVPLYRLFCQVTGFAGTPQRAEMAPENATTREMTVRFDANVSGGLDWDFSPVQQALSLKVGAESLAFYRATNRSSKPLTGTAVFNVTPGEAGAYFTKIECFCFTEQTLKPGQTVDMPVQFFIDPAIEKDKDFKSLSTVTLSYTFYPAAQPLAATTN